MTLPASPLRDALSACAAPLQAPLETPLETPDVADTAHGKSAGAWRRDYCFPATSLVFAGHFPGQPVLPAVVQTLMAQMTVEAALAARPPHLLAITQAKFSAVLGPDMPITVHVRPATKPGHWDCTLHARHAAKPAAATPGEATPDEEATLAAKIQLHMAMPQATDPHDPHEAHA